SLQLKIDGSTAEAAFDGEIDAEVFHGRIEKFLDDLVQPVNFIDEKHVTFLKVGQRAHQVALLDDGRPAGDADSVGDAHLFSDDVSQRRFAQSGRPIKQDMFKRLAALFGGIEGDLELLNHLALADAVGEAARAEGKVDLLFALG